MLTIRSLALLAAATFVAGQAIESLDACGQTCFNNVKAEAGRWNCSADNMACLCAVGDFKNGVHDCAKAACAADYAGVVVAAVNALCATAAPPAPTPEPTTAAPAPEETAPAPAETTEPAVATVASSTAIASTSVNTSTPTVETSTTSAATEATPTSTSSEEVAAKPTEAPTTSTTSSSEVETTSPAENTQSNEPAGLTVGAKAGIGIGAGAAAIALIGVAAWAIARQRKNKRANGFSSKHMIKISDPAPGGGRSFAGDHHYETGLSELEMKSRRYEDMVPRQQPRHMV